jgi:hypothetical protein
VRAGLRCTSNSTVVKGNKLALDFPDETLFDHNNCTATIGDHVILHNYPTWALRCEEVKAPGPQQSEHLNSGEVSDELE